MHTHSSSEMKLEHSYILRLVLVFVRVLCSSDNELYLVWYWSFCVVCLSNWVISLIGNSRRMGHSDDLTMVMRTNAVSRTWDTSTSHSTLDGI